MTTIFSLDHLPKLDGCILTIGSFDGLHLGHQSVFNRLRFLHKENKKEIVLFSFLQHPRNILDNFQPISLLTTLEEKIYLIEKKMPFIHYLVAAPFTKEFANISAENFISKILVEKFKPSIIVVGHDHQFGKNRLGDIFLLSKYAPLFSYQVEEISLHTTQKQKTSSTLIRKAIIEGDIELANQRLGYLYFIKGTVVDGKKIGRTIGFPTANIYVSAYEKLIPKIGVYAVNIHIQKLTKTIRKKGMMNIGHNPTLTNNLDIKIEVNIFDFNENIYHEKVLIEIKKRIRDEIKFESVDALKRQLESDKLNCLR